MFSSRGCQLQVSSTSSLWLEPGHEAEIFLENEYHCLGSKNTLFHGVCEQLPSPDQINCTEVYNKAASAPLKKDVLQSLKLAAAAGLL